MFKIVGRYIKPRCLIVDIQQTWHLEAQRPVSTVRPYRNIVSSSVRHDKSISSQRALLVLIFCVQENDKNC